MKYIHKIEIFTNEWGESDISIEKQVKGLNGDHTTGNQMVDRQKANLSHFLLRKYKLKS